MLVSCNRRNTSSSVKKAGVRVAVALDVVEATAVGTVEAVVADGVMVADGVVVAAVEAVARAVVAVAGEEDAGRRGCCCFCCLMRHNPRRESLELCSFSNRCRWLVRVRKSVNIYLISYATHCVFTESLKSASITAHCFVAPIRLVVVFRFFFFFFRFWSFLCFCPRASACSSLD